MRTPDPASSSSAASGRVRPHAEASPPPDVVGYLLEEARAVLAEAGWPDIETTETRPPRRALTGPLRVLRQQIAASGRIALVVSGERPAVPSGDPAAAPSIPGGGVPPEAAARSGQGTSGAASGGTPP